MVSKATIVLITLFVAFLLYSVLNVLSTEHASEDEVENYKIITENKVLYDDNIYWTGLPISKGNYFFVEPSDKTKRFYDDYKEELFLLIDNDTDEKMDVVYNKYYQLIGINGILDGVNDYEHELAHSSLVHHLGEYIYSKIKESGNVTYGIEICSRNILSKAPLHGYVWSAINESSQNYLKGLSDEERKNSLNDAHFLQFLFNFIDTKLCYFKTATNMTKIYSSCLHGVGHGLSDVFGEDGIKNAVEVCGMRDNHDFNYLCSTGIYMDTTPNYLNFTPCDTNRYPAACFRFQSVQWQAMKRGNENISHICSKFEDRYLHIGCVWGYNYCDHKTFYKDAYEVCKDFEVDEIDGFLEPSFVGDPNDDLKFRNRLYLACVDGFLSQSKIKKATEKVVKKTCKKFKNHNYIMNYCYEMAKPLKEAESEDEDGENWNFQLLEYDYNPKYDFHQVKFPENLANILTNGVEKSEEKHQH